MMFMWFFSDFLYKSIHCRYSFELHRQVDAIQMGTHNICLYNEVDKKYTGSNLKTTELLDCVFIGVYAVIRSNTICRVILYLSCNELGSVNLCSLIWFIIKACLIVYILCKGKYRHPAWSLNRLIKVFPINIGVNVQFFSCVF